MKKAINSEPSSGAQKQGIRIDVKTYISTVIILLVVMIAAGCLTRFLPQSSFERVEVNGYETINIESYDVDENADRLPVWRWFTAPFEVLGSDSGVMAIFIILFIVFIGGTFMLLDKSGVMRYIICSAVDRFGRSKYLLLAVMVFIGMLLGSACGMFEEAAALVPIVVGVSLALGWDSFIGLGMSILSIGFGFAAGTLNPFSVVVAQRLAGIEVYSGLLVRVAIFFVIYALLLTYLVIYAKKIEKNPEKSLSYEGDKELRVKYTYERDDEFMSNPKMKAATAVFFSAFGLAVAYIIVSLFVDGLGDYTMPVMLVCFAGGGLIAGKISGYAKKGILLDFGKGMLTIAPCVLLVIMAMSAKQIVTAGGVMDTILYGAYMFLRDINPIWAILLIYAFVLVLEFFVSSASAKAFIVIPIVVPLVQMIGAGSRMAIFPQTIVQAYCFGDGFSNMFMPTNAALFIVLGLVNISYGKWMRWALPLQLLTLLVTSGILMLCVVFGYN